MLTKFKSEPVILHVVFVFFLKKVLPALVIFLQLCAAVSFSISIFDLLVTADLLMSYNIHIFPISIILASHLFNLASFEDSLKYCFNWPIFYLMKMLVHFASHLLSLLGIGKNVFIINFLMHTFIIGIYKYNLSFSVCLHA